MSLEIASGSDKLPSVGDIAPQASEPDAMGSVMDHIDLSTIFLIMLSAAFIVAAVVLYERGRHP